ncbi:hypothetical protein HCN44_001798, partial [Aphidius gifuensis]
QKESSRDNKNETDNSKKSHDADKETVDREIRLKKNKCTSSSKLSPVLKKKIKFSTENEETNKLESHQSTSKSSKKEIHKKSGVYVTKEKWEDAKRKKKFSTMTGALIEAVFPLEVLLINGVRKYHGSPLSKSSFSTAVNQRCTTLSSTHRALQEITTHWMALDLPFEREFAIKNKLLRYSWALPLAVEHQNKKDTLEDAIKSLPDYLEYPNTKVFINEVKEKWSSRIKYVLPFSTYHDIHTSIESHERRLELEFSSEIKTHFVLGKK